MNARANLIATLLMVYGPFAFAFVERKASAQESADAISVRVGSLEEFEAAVKRMRPGSEVVMAAGEWRDAELRFDAIGTQERPITLRAEKSGATILTGSSRLHIGGSHLVVAGLWFREPVTSKGDVIEFRRDSKQLAHDCRLTACAITASNPAGANATEGRWLSLYGARHRVDHCYFAGKTSAGTTVVVWLGAEPEGNHLLDHNHFGERTRLGKNGGETIRIGDSKTADRSAHCMVADNLFEHCNGETEIISNKSCDNTYTRNTFLECEGTLTLRHGHRAVVDGNWFLGQGRKLTGGVRVIGEDHRVVNNYFGGLTGEEFRCAITFMNGIPQTPANGYQQVRRAVVAFNTIADCRHPFMLGLADNSNATLPPAECLIAANVVYCPQSQLAEAPSDARGIRWTGNLVQTKSLGVDLQDESKTTSFSMALGADRIWRTVGALPAAATLPDEFELPQIDIDGQPRTVPPQPGCDETSTAPIRYSPPNRSTTGPSWWKD